MGGTSSCCRNSNSSKSHGFTATYNSADHCQVLLQCFGSVWPKVLPYCLVNVAISIVLQYLENVQNVDFQVTDKGHSFLTMLVSFLIVTRATVSLARYNSVRAHVSNIFCKSRQLMHQVALFSLDNLDESGKQWRHELTYLLLLHLRAVMAVIDYESDGIPAWELPEMDKNLAAELKTRLFLDESTMRFAHHSVVSENEENMRVPIRLALSIREKVIAQRKELTTPFSGSEENRLLGSIDAVMNGYYGIRTFLTTPFPFPLLQMSRTFLFFYLFTTPFALLSNIAMPIAHCVVVFFLTFGFMGLEYVALEFDDPFGDDANDFNNNRMAQVAFEDTYTTIDDVDGKEWTDKLRRRMDAGVSAQNIPPEAAAWLHKPGVV